MCQVNLDREKLNSERVSNLKKAKENNTYRKDISFVFDDLVNLVQLRLSNEFQEVISKKAIKSIIQCVIYSIIDISLRGKPLVLTGILKAYSYVNPNGLHTIKFKLSSILKNMINSNTALYDDTKLVSLDIIEVNQKTQTFKSSLDEGQKKFNKLKKVLLKTKNIDNVTQNLTKNVIQNSLQNDLKNDIINSISSKEILNMSDSNKMEVSNALNLGIDDDDDFDVNDLM